MALTARRDTVVSFNKGFTSDASAVNFPKDFSVDEQNYDIEIDGTRRRRRGLSQDAGGLEVSIDRDEDERCRSFKWPAAANNSSSNFEAVHFGRLVKFFVDADNATVPTEKDFSIDLTAYKTSSTSDAEVDAQRVDMAVSRGELIIVGEYIDPLVVTYDPASDNITVQRIQLKERDLFGADDGISNQVMPVTLTAGHAYNLINQGWTQTNYDQFKTDTGFYPSKNMVYGRGFRRVIVTGVADIDGTKEFSSDKLIAELFQDAPAPHGHFIVNPFNTVSNPLSETSSAIYNIVTDLDLTPGTPGVNTVTITTAAAHGLAPTDTIHFLEFCGFSFISSVDGSTQQSGIAGGPFTVVATPTGTTFTLSVDFSSIVGLQNPVTLLNNVSIVEADNVIVNPLGTTTRLRPSAVAFFAGRIWYAGINAGKLTTKLYFSQVVETVGQFGKAYQVADPTDENISDLVSTDGGTINIPEMGICFALLPHSSGLLVYSFNGVWFIGPGAGGIFAADSYSVRKISEVGVDGPASIVMAENFPHYWGRNSIYRVTQDASEGFLVAQNISIGRIDMFFNSLPTSSRQTVQAAYDPLLKKIYWAYRATESEDANPGFNRLLVLDLKYNAYLKLSMPQANVTQVDLGFDPPLSTNEFSVASLFATKTPNPSSPQSTIKFVTQRASDSVFTEFNGATPLDELYSTDERAEETAFLLTGFDTGGVPSNRKQALYITVYSKKTETGYNTVGLDFVPIDESSTLMQTRFDWADHVNAGKWGPEQEVYRHTRLYTPADSNDNFDDGVPVVVTRNKVRGRGRSLHIKFTAGQGKHSHIMGWSTNYRILTEE